MSQSGPSLPTLPVPQVGSYLGWTGRDANVVAKAAFDPEPTFGPPTNPKKTIEAIGGDP
jgi:hypothetical protein